jgi:hydrogenase maturation factor
MHRYGREIQQRAVSYFRDYSVVKDSLTVASVGVRDNGVTAMHDATEGGVLGALHEFAMAARCGIRIKKADIPVSSETQKICELFNLDPYISLSEGTLLAAVRPTHVEKVLSALRYKQIVAADIGELLPASEGMWIEVNGSAEKLEAVEVDPYWQAYAQAIEKGWK